MKKNINSNQPDMLEQHSFERVIFFETDDQGQQKRRTGSVCRICGKLLKRIGLSRMLMHRLVMIIQ